MSGVPTVLVSKFQRQIALRQKTRKLRRNGLQIGTYLSPRLTLGKIVSIEFGGNALLINDTNIKRESAQDSPGMVNAHIAP
jgi:hypothetical protein